MKTSSEIDQSLNQTLTILVSAIIHAALMVGICCSATEQKEKPIVVATKLIELKTMPLPPSPKKETPPPKKETPPPPPKPVEPPKPQPPKPVEPPKPQPPKPVEVKPPTPTPAVVKTETPKPDAPKKLTRAEELRKQLESATVKEMKNPPRPQPQPYTPPRPVQPVQTKSAEQYAKEAMAGVSNDTQVNLPPVQGRTAAEQTTEYAQNYVSPILYQYWNPSRAGMTNRNPSAVEISFMISIDGVVSNVRITKPSNDAVMTSSVEELVKQIRSGQIRFPSLRDAGINRPFLQISVTMHLKD